LPIVDALKAEPKRPRVWHGDGGIAGEVKGMVTNGGGVTLRLARGDAWIDTTKAGADGRYTFVDVPFERYQLTVVQLPGIAREVLLSPNQPVATVNFELPPANTQPANSSVRGTITGGAGMTVRLARPSDGWNQSQAIAGDGRYRFSGLKRANTYWGWPAPTSRARTSFWTAGMRSSSI
jgi:hypothetical protein